MGLCESKNDNLQSQIINQNIVTQIGKNICKIYFINDNIETGFFCKVPILSQSKLIPVLVTDSKLNISMNNSIKIYFIDINDNKIEKNLELNHSRLVYTNNDINTNFIEILPKLDGINTSNFLEIDENIYQNNNIENYKEQAIYSLLLNNQN